MVHTCADVARPEFVIGGRRLASTSAMDNGPTHASPEAFVFIRMLDLLLSVSKEDLEKEMKQEKERSAKQRAPGGSKTSGNTT